MAVMGDRPDQLDQLIAMELNTIRRDTNEIRDRLGLARLDYGLPVTADIVVRYQGHRR